MSELQNEIREQLEKAVTDFCEACAEKDSPCEPLSSDNECSRIAPIKRHLDDLKGASE
jgi:hypothetical protein